MTPQIEEGDEMGHMKDLDRRIRQGGDDAIAAACELAGIAKERRAYEDTMRATIDITDIVTVLRAVGFAAVPPSAGDSASLLHYCVTHAADEIERLRLLSANGDCPDRDNAANRDNTPATHDTSSEGREQGECTITDAEREAVEWCVEMAMNSATDCVAEINTLRGLLERME